MWLYTLHKSLGLTVLALVVHRALYALMLAVPPAGWSASDASWIETRPWSLPLPRVAPFSEAWQDRGFALHALLATMLAALVALQVAAALWHALWGRDDRLRRMLKG